METFNGTSISHERKGCYKLFQENKLENIILPTDSASAISVRAQLQYISCASRPDLSSPVQLLTAELQAPTPKSFKKLNTIINHAKETKSLGLKFIRLSGKYLRIMLFTDASFGNIIDYSSQTGFIVLLADEHGNANILHYGSKRCRRVTRSIMAAELLALVSGFDNAYIVKSILEEVFARKFPIEVYTDSRTTFNCIAKHAKTSEKRLQIDAAALRESYIRGEISAFAWVPGYQNPADGLTKDKILSQEHPLRKLIKDNKIEVHPEG